MTIKREPLTAVFEQVGFQGGTKTLFCVYGAENVSSFISIFVV
jgi:hypothetical protein